MHGFEEKQTSMIPSVSVQLIGGVLALSLVSVARRAASFFQRNDNPFTNIASFESLLNLAREMCAHFARYMMESGTKAAVKSLGNTAPQGL
jgi:hypothetical protein